MVKRLTGQDQNNLPLNNVPTPLSDGDAANKAYVDDNKVTIDSSTYSQFPLSSAWTFPDNSINGEVDIESNYFYMLKPIWFEVDSSASGSIILRNDSSFGTNFYYTADNAKIVRQNSTVQYVNIACADVNNMNALCSSPSNRAAAIATLVSFCEDNLFEGVELDFEDYGSWDTVSGSYDNYKTFVTELGTALHDVDLKLMIDCPPIWNDSTTTTSNEWTGRNSQGYYDFKYEDFESLPVDYLVPMIYDYQYDLGAGVPNQPLEWLDDCLTWVKSKITDHNRIIAGLPSAGYSGATGGYAITGRTFTYLSGRPGFSYNVRDDSSGELIWANGGNSYAALDDVSINIKIRRVMANGIFSYSLWHIGENKYGNVPFNTQTGVVKSSTVTTITAGTTAPSSPSVGDLWVDMN